MAVSVAIALIGIAVAFYLYIWKTEVPKRMGERFKTIYTIIFNKYYVDEIYEACFVNSTKRLGYLLVAGVRRRGGGSQREPGGSSDARARRASCAGSRPVVSRDTPSASSWAPLLSCIFLIR